MVRVSPSCISPFICTLEPCPLKSARCSQAYFPFICTLNPFELCCPFMTGAVLASEPTASSTGDRRTVAVDMNQDETGKELDVAFSMALKLAQQVNGLRMIVFHTD